MIENNDENVRQDWLEDLPVDTRVDSYRPEEMISCTKCDRDNPPNRLECLYCGVKLELSQEQRKNLRPILRKTDTWKNAINLIFVSKHSNLTEDDLKEIAKMTRLEMEMVTAIIDYGKPLPLARSEQNEKIEIVSARLSEFGVESVLVPDSVLDVNLPPKRLRKIEFKDGVVEFGLFNSGEVRKLRPDELRLIVTGALFERRVESSEKQLRKKENKILEMAETSIDEMLIDIYDRENADGYRISANGFDFSGLGSAKGMIANENIKMIVEKLCEFSSEVELDEDYLRLRAVLSGIWEIDEQIDSKGLNRKGLGGYKRTTVTTTDNLKQFTKYSRLRRFLNEDKK